MPNILEIVNKSNNSLPEYKTSGSSGLDLQAFLSEDLKLRPFERCLVSTGLFVAIPEGYEGQVRARSGLSIKHGITLVNAVGTIDSDYRGEIKVPLINLSNDDYTIKSGERIAQLVITKYERVRTVELDELSTTDRGEGGFGSTGK